MTSLLSHRYRLTLLSVAAFVAASLVATLLAWAAASLIESRSARAVGKALSQQGITWASVAADGLQVRLEGIAPNEAARFRALNLAGSVVEPTRVVDATEVAPARAIEAPKYSVEMLRNDDGIQLIGLLPSAGDEERLTERARALMPAVAPSEMIETAGYPAPDTWAAAFDYGIAALELLPRSKISVDAGRVEITAIAASDTEKRRFERDLGRAKPEGVAVVIDISAPRPVLTPFTLRFVKDASGLRFDACSADTEAARDRILAAAAAAGVPGRPSCTIGLGVPTPRWAAAAEAGIKAIAQLDAGTVTFSDADVTLMASEDTPQATFDRVVGELQNALPPVFSLDATLPKKQIAAPEGPAEFTAILNGATGRVELRGRVTDEVQRDAVESFARARFGADKVYVGTRFDPGLPGGWPVRVLAALDSLGRLHEGSVLVRPDLVEVKGITGSQSARADIAQILSGKLGQGQTFRVDVTYDEEFDPMAALPTPQECHDMIEALFRKQKITFAPGSAEIDAKSGPVMTRLADIVKKCQGVRMEIGGYTDSQGSEEGNRALSQARAEAVLLALQGRRVDVSYLRAVGHGEDDPVADNGTDEGRETNRRIEFTLAENAKPLQPLPPAQPAGGEAAAASPAASCRDRIAALLTRTKISFDPGSAVIATASAGVIRDIAAELNGCPGIPMEIGGHTDSQGSVGGNQKLSQDRANAVMVALAKLGADISRLKAVGYGEANPIADNKTDAGRETNRRIEFILIGPRGQTAVAQPTEEGAATQTGGDGDPAAGPGDDADAPAMDDLGGDGTEPAAPSEGATPDDGASAPAAPGGEDSAVPDFSDDDGPSLAPQEKTQPPRLRPDQNG